MLWQDPVVFVFVDIGVVIVTWHYCHDVVGTAGGCWWHAKRENVKGWWETVCPYVVWASSFFSRCVNRTFEHHKTVVPPSSVSRTPRGSRVVGVHVVFLLESEIILARILYTRPLMNSAKILSESESHICLQRVPGIRQT